MQATNMQHFRIRRWLKKPFVLHLPLAGAAPLLAESCISATDIAIGRGHGSKFVILDDHLDLPVFFKIAAVINE